MIDRGVEPQLIERDRPQLPRHAIYLAAKLADQRTQLIQHLPPRCAGIAERIEFQAKRRQVLRQAVVQLAGDPLPLVFLSYDHAVQ